MKHRLQRVEEAIKRELGDIITRTLTFGGEALPTIHEVSISADLRQCHVYVGVLGDQKAGNDVIHKLLDARGILQVALAKRVIIKYTPHLHFHLDSSVERGVRVLQLLEELPPIQEDDPAVLARNPEPVFDTDLPEDEEEDDDLMEDELDDDEDEEEEEDDAPAEAAPAAAPIRRRARPRNNRVQLPED
jgi:ribosome-binding factor A